ncbi:MAG: long-chain-fatty-acid--CoA ligase [Hyphomicrobiales bacterium]|nr:long-chain-fatty-acid--CoA ligase [Hyphomicrobiales bacterium]MCP5373729.1 long-chain-fatty-acid--CoA ligase [Hyphomicrobiales bacterium]
MLGLMQSKQLMISSILTHAAREHGEQEIVSAAVEGGMHRYTYADAEKRTKQLANALKALGVGVGDRVGTLAWNGYRHFELYYAISGIGAVCHTINPRLFPQQVAYIINHAGDKYLFVDLNILPLLEALAPHMPRVEGVVIMTDAAHMPETKLAETHKVICYEDLIGAEPETFDWPVFDENTAAGLCYTSGTTGNPKGVLYSHRSTLLHAYAVQMKDVAPVGAADCVLPVVPMFHVNAWGLPYAVPMAGGKLMMPGFRLDGENLTQMMNDEKVTLSSGVPTIWLGLLQYLRASGKRLETVKSLMIGGAACPLAIIEGFGKEFGVSIIHGWGMTELSPVGTLNAPKPGMEDYSDDDRYRHQLKQGRALFGFEMKVVDEDGNEQPRDGKSFGRLLCRGPWVCSAYYNDTENPDGILDDDGWFDTGDVATIDSQGYMQITDRTKDLIKSGGEWISSIELENIAVGHPGIQEAAVIALPHPKWDERPFVIAVRNEGADVDRDGLLDYYKGKIADWMIPDDVVFVDELPHTATGKLLKTDLRQKFAEHKLPTA